MNNMSKKRVMSLLGLATRARKVVWSTTRSIWKITYGVRRLWIICLKKE